MKGIVSEKWHKSSTDVPVYQQVATFIEQAILSGDLPKGYVLPGHRSMAKMFDVGVNTILHTLHILDKNQFIKLNARSRPVVQKPHCCKPDWDKYICSSLYNPTKSNFFSFAENHYGAMNMSMGLDKDYYFRELFNEVLPNISIPPVLHTNPLGLPILRREIAWHMEKHGIKAAQENIMIVTSVFHAINILFIGLLGHGTNLILPKNCNMSISNLVRTTGANVIEIPIDKEGMVIDKMLKAIYSESDCVLCISPDQNLPTGTVTSLERRMEILEICTKWRVPIIEHTLFPLGCTFTNIPSMKAMDNDGIVIHVSQIGAAGSTNPWLGWMIADEYLLKKLNNIRFNLDAHQNYLMQIATLEVFSTGRYDAFLKRILNTRKRRYKEVNSLLEEYMGDIASWNATNTDSCVWLNFNKGINTYHMYKKAEGMTFHPGKFYDENDTTHVFLYPVALNMQNFEKGLILIKGLAEAQFASL